MEALVTQEQMDQVKDWYSKRGISFDFDILPKFGVIVDGVAAGFMFLTTDNKAIIEGIIANPESSLSERSKAIDDIINGLTETARNVGCKYVFGLSEVSSIVRRSEKIGYDNVGSYNLLIKRF